MKRPTVSFPALARLGALVTLYSLDLLDLYGKIAWIGPSESFSFSAVHERNFELEPLPRPKFLAADAPRSTTTSALGTDLLRATGWTSYYDKCSDLYATKNSDKFDMVKAENCDLGAHFSAEPLVAPELVLSASLRADSVAWVSCQLLFFHRRPPICQENLVTLFSQRYQLTENEKDHDDDDDMAPINSMAEAELLRMLNLLSRSHPLSNVTCAQGFESTAGPGHYETSVFICGSPNVFESAFVGVFATNFAELAKSLAWLAVDKVNAMGFELVSRQNSRSQFRLHEKDGEIVVIERSATNFATFGHLYVALLVVDIALLISHVRATFDTLQMFGWRELLGFKGADDNGGDKYGDSSWIMLYRSLYRSETIAGLTIFSALTSWFVNFPFALMWRNNSSGKAYALLAAVRVWMLVLCLLNLLWSTIVRLSETRAYKMAARSFVSPLEVLAASGFVVLLETGRLFGVAEVRRLLEGQLIVDDEAFPGRFAVSNAYSEEVDGFATTSPRMLHVLVAPLVAVVIESLALLILVLIIKSVHYRRQLLRQRQQQDSSTTDSVSVVDFDNLDQILDEPAPDPRAPIAPLLTRRRPKNYHRLPLEDLLQTPARANSLVRCCFDVDEVEDDGHTYMLPQVYYDFGVVVSAAGFLRTRRGFPTVIHRRLDVEKFFAPTEKAFAVSPVSFRLPRVSFRRTQKVRDPNPSSRAKFALNSVTPPIEKVKATQDTPPMPRTLSELKRSPMSRSMRRRKSMEDILEDAPTT